MSWYKGYKLIRASNGYIVKIYLNPNAPEFSVELIADIKENILELDEQINKFLKEKFSKLKINSVKLMLGTLLVGTIPFTGHVKAHAAEAVSGSHRQTMPHPYIISKLNTTGKVTATALNVRKGPSTSYPVMHLLWRGNKVKVIGESNGWIEIKLSDGRVGWVKQSYLKLNISIINRQQKIHHLISTAKSLLGTPYVWGGTSLKNGGFDCSGFTKYVFKGVGCDLNRISSEQAKQGAYVSRNDLEPGDLVFFSFEGNGRISHVGIYLGNGKMIHSPKTGDSVKITNITTGFWQSRFVTARRII